MHDPTVEPDDTFDGGSMDCGSGLSLIIRKRILALPLGAILEIRSTEPTVVTELPPWCRLSGHRYLGTTEREPGQWFHWIERGTEDGESTEAHLLKAREFTWSLRTRRDPAGTLSTFTRNHSWKSKGSISFDRRSDWPTSLEQFVGAITTDILACFERACETQRLVIDDLEATLSTRLHHPLAAMGIEDGDPSIATLKIVAYVTSAASGHSLQTAWEAGLQHSPLFNTLRTACDIETRLVVM